MDELPASPIKSSILNSSFSMPNNNKGFISWTNYTAAAKEISTKAPEPKPVGTVTKLVPSVQLKPNLEDSFDNDPDFADFTSAVNLKSSGGIIITQISPRKGDSFDEIDDLRNQIGRSDILTMPIGTDEEDEEDIPPTFEQSGSEMDDFDSVFSSFSTPEQTNIPISFDLSNFQLSPEMQNAWESCEVDFNRSTKGWNSVIAVEKEPSEHLYNIRTMSIDWILGFTMRTLKGGYSGLTKSEPDQPAVQEIKAKSPVEEHKANLTEQQRNLLAKFTEEDDS